MFHRRGGPTRVGLAAGLAVVLCLGAAKVSSAAAAGKAGSARLPAGEYDCGGGYPFRAMGKVDIKGSEYRYRPYEDVVSGFKSYSVDENGAIHWSGRFGGLDDPPAQIDMTTKESFGFRVSYRSKPGGSVDQMDCQVLPK